MVSGCAVAERQAAPRHHDPRDASGREDTTQLAKQHGGRVARLERVSDDGNIEQRLDERQAERINDYRANCAARPARDGDGEVPDRGSVAGVERGVAIRQHAGRRGQVEAVAKGGTKAWIDDGLPLARCGTTV